MEKKKVMIVGNKDEIAKRLAEVGMEDEVEIVSTENVTAFDRPSYLVTMPDPELFDMRGIIDDDWNKISKSDRRGTVAEVRNSKVDPKIQRNEPCPCGSGQKYKKCCGKL